MIDSDRNVHKRREMMTYDVNITKRISALIHSRREGFWLLTKNLQGKSCNVTNVKTIELREHFPKDSVYEITTYTVPEDLEKLESIVRRNLNAFSAGEASSKTAIRSFLGMND